MAISKFEQHRYEKLLQDFCQEQGPPPHLHDKLKWGYEVDPKKQTVELFNSSSLHGTIKKGPKSDCQSELCQRSEELEGLLDEE